MLPLTFIWKFITRTDFVTFCLNTKLNTFYTVYDSHYTKRSKLRKLDIFVTLELGRSVRAMW